jgi:hypothetical protein
MRPKEARYGAELKHRPDRGEALCPAFFIAQEEKAGYGKFRGGIPIPPDAD